jgi:hypothetical protein
MPIEIQPRLKSRKQARAKDLAQWLGRPYKRCQLRLWATTRFSFGEDVVGFAIYALPYATRLNVQAEIEKNYISQGYEIWRDDKGIVYGEIHGRCVGARLDVLARQKDSTAAVVREIKTGRAYGHQDEFQVRIARAIALQDPRTRLFLDDRDPNAGIDRKLLAVQDSEITSEDVAALTATDLELLREPLEIAFSEKAPWASDGEQCYDCDYRNWCPTGTRWFAGRRKKGHTQEPSLHGFMHAT